MRRVRDVQVQVRRQRQGRRERDLCCSCSREGCALLRRGRGLWHVFFFFLLFVCWMGWEGGICTAGRKSERKRGDLCLHGFVSDAGFFCVWLLLFSHLLLVGCG